MKLQQQTAQFGTSVQGMPPLEVSRGADGEFVVNNGVTRATRIAKLLPGVSVRVEVIDEISSGKLTTEYSYHQGYWDGAEREFRRALELSPSNADAHDLYGRLCSALGRQDESIAMQRRAQELDPIEHRSDYANSLLRAGRYDEAIQAAERALEIDPLYQRDPRVAGPADD